MLKNDFRSGFCPGACLLCDENVGAFDVPVDDALVMKIAHAKQNLSSAGAEELSVQY